MEEHWEGETLTGAASGPYLSGAIVTVEAEVELEVTEELVAEAS
jgi:hypothetical protein